MSNSMIIRAWKDEEYRASLSNAERAALPANPAGLVELTDTDLLGVEGAATTVACSIFTVITIVTIVVSQANTCKHLCS